MDRCKWWLMLLVAFVASTDALPLDAASSSATSATSATSPTGGGGMEFPNTAFIPGDLTEQLNIDDFFSLWLFFLDDDVSTSGKIPMAFTAILTIQLFLLKTSKYSW